jgi:tRNA A37 threonylcarbamoyladenosine dehydratase
VYSEEEPLTPEEDEESALAAAMTGRRSIPGSTAFVPPAAGLMIASEVVKDLISAGKHDHG